MGLWAETISLKLFIGAALLTLVILLEGANANFMGTYMRHPTVCVDIPYDLKLCRNVGYVRMVLPNLLDHESLDEVRQQASSFVPLLGQHCHPHLQEFLCSLFAPVCLPKESIFSGAIPPCKAFCRSVERSCEPVMKKYNFQWPSMLNCSKFTDQDPCVLLEDPTQTIPSINDTTTPVHISTTPSSCACAPCGVELRQESLYDNYCANEFVLKIKAKKVKKKGKGNYEITADRKRRVIYKQGPITKKYLRRLKFLVPCSKKCTCPPLDLAKKKKKGRKRKQFYLVMGRMVDEKLYVTVLHSWTKRNRILRQAHKTFFKGRNCADFGMPILS